MNRPFVLAAVAMTLYFFPPPSARAALEIAVNNKEPFVSLPLDKQTWLTEQDNARFTKGKDGIVWISDIEHVIDEKTGDIYLADGKTRLYMYGDTVPAGKSFELFPYHYYDKEEEQKLGKRINYSLILKNISGAEATVKIEGMGTTRDWDHYKTWEGAFRGDNKKTITLKPNEVYTLWNAKGLEGGLPWSAIVFGKSTGDLWVCDYAYLGDKDPGVEGAYPQPDLAWPPYLLASFTRGTAPWNTASIDLFPKQRDGKDRIPLKSIGDGVYSFAFAYSPGGPITNLCEYKAVQPTFLEDRLVVKDPATGYSHVFFGGNYPIMYKFRIPVVNDTAEVKSVSFYLCSNDTLKVDTIAGVWIGRKMLWRRVPMVGKNEHWRIASATVKPGGSEVMEFTVVPLGSRWGGMIGSLDVGPTAKK